MIRNDATARQVQAAAPDWSTWLSANAGSGKTRVLTDRVARLLLAGVEPGRILCLTYTKAAATEMQNRLFHRLGAWAMLEDAKLRAELLDLGVESAIDAGTLTSARRLFARAIETPGGLRIQTIHSFCATLLRRFPLEARVSPQFTELDDRAARLLRDEIIEEIAAYRAPGVIEALARTYVGEDFASIASEVAAQRAHLEHPLSLAECYGLFGLPADISADTLLAEVFLGGEQEWLPKAAAIIAKGSANDVKAAAKILALNLALPSLATLSTMEDVFLTGSGAKIPFAAKIGALPTKATQAALGALLDPLENLMRRVETARASRLALLAAQKAANLHAFARVFLPEYAARKSARGMLDFDDLITSAKSLLTDPQVAQWVLFRLDGGIDHILVDEAQDTSPDQWRVIELLAQEFTAGRGARDVDRTIFIVGDPKQSIYSFQGADVAAFSAMRDKFKSSLNAINAPFQELDLEHSFRSSPTILRLVDLTFDERRQADLGGASRHLAFKDAMPGRAELWPVIDSAKDPDDDEWENPVDLISDEHHDAQLAKRIAARIRQLIDAGTMIPEKDHFRPVHAGDFLILVRRRSTLFAEIIRACKSAGLPIAGADRLKLGAELAVKDLASLLAFLATPEDDLALAEVLRSPLFGWTEQQLFHLAQPREKYLWSALRQSKDSHSETLAILNDLRNQADFLRPFDLIERALTRHDGRRRLLARLGAEAEDGIDELLSQALAYEQNDVPSLTGFLTWLQTDNIEVKRQMDSAGRRIRVMTVHGAKGLEAPIVILPDTADRKANNGGELLRLADNRIAWKTAADASPDAITAAQVERVAKSESENLRLLYVAMTRAQCWLMVAAAGKTNQAHAWYNLIQSGMQAIGATAQPDGTLWIESGDWPAPAPASEAEADPLPELPSWALTPAGQPEHAPKPLSPSNLGGAKVLPGDYDGETDAAMLRGTHLHLLLEHLPDQPAERWADLAKSLLPDNAETSGLLNEAAAVITAPDLASIFTRSALKEVSITAEMDGQRLYGTIDRLIITPEKILAIDYKSNRLVPQDSAAIPDGLRRQMAAYATALAQIYPGRTIETSILWTASARLMTVT